ncbi:zinc-binding dehydrogenase [Chloroflexi bacterium TSY]|nr:zinc-binding dehydrogenase [Chloroflexi bacterium TSY]
MRAAVVQDFVNDVEVGHVPVSLDRTFTLDEIVDAHRYMEANKARGKIAVLP